MPVAISTDDAGVSRINMTNEYFRAVHDQWLDYYDPEAIVRNALIYSFLDEDQKRSELEGFDRSFIDSERLVAPRLLGGQRPRSSRRRPSCGLKSPHG